MLEENLRKTPREIKGKPEEVLCTRILLTNNVNFSTQYTENTAPKVTIVSCLFSFSASQAALHINSI